MRPSQPCESELDQPRSVITLAQIETFLALVEEGGVARAAERLGVGRSTVSARIGTSEKVVGAVYGRAGVRHTCVPAQTLRLRHSSAA